MKGTTLPVSSSRVCHVNRLVVLAALAALGLLGGCTTLRAISMLRGGEGRMPTESPCRVPFTEVGHIVLVQATLNDLTTPYVFIFDTGAGISVVSQRVATALGLSATVEVDGRDAEGKTAKVGIAQLASLALGSARVSNCAVGLHDFGSLEKQLDIERIDGIIGSNFVRHFSVTLDYEAREIGLAAQATPPVAVAGAEILPFRTQLSSGYSPIVTLTLQGASENPLDVEALVDTGAAQALCLPLAVLHELAATHDGTVPQLVRSEGGMSAGALGQAAESAMARVKRVRIGNLDFADVAVQSCGTDRALIGREFLAQFRVTLDFKREEVTLLAKQPPRLAHDRFSVGMSLRKTEDGRRVVVGGLWRGGPADVNGVEVGDEIVTIGTTPASDMTIFAIRRILDDDAVERLTLVVRSRDNETRTVELHKEWLFASRDAVAE